MDKQTIIECYNNITKPPYTAARQEFIDNYSPDVLDNLQGAELAKRLFNGENSEKHGETRGLFSWLEYGKSPNTPKGTFGQAKDANGTFGILRQYNASSTAWGYKLYVGRNNTAISQADAIAYADTVKEVIIKINDLFSSFSPKEVNEYTSLENEIKKINSEKHFLYCNNNGELKQSILKYFHILYPDILCGFYSQNYLENIAKVLGIKTQGLSRFCINGAISLYRKNLSEETNTNLDGIYFAQAVHSLIGENISQNNTSEQTNNSQENQTKMSTTTNKHELNLILYGPPGTGKTYNTVIKAVEIIDGHASLDATGAVDYDKTLKRYRELMDQGRIAFTTFHQSYGYEDFIQGIKPAFKDDDSDSIKYELADGVFKEFCDRAKRLKSDSTKNFGFNDSPKIWKVSLEGTGKNPTRSDCLKNEHIRIGFDSYGKDITDETKITEGKNVLNAFINYMSEGDIVISCYSATSTDAIGVVTGDYEWHDEYENYKRLRKVKWLVKGINEDITHINGDKIMSLSTVHRLYINIDDIVKIINKHQNQTAQIEYDYETPYVFIIDEINRGNVSKIFGELITLIEPSKRLGAKEEMYCKLPNQPNKHFGVPKNVYILGTMNTADRSLVQLDIALRRRFAFEEMMPQPNLLRSTNDGINLDLLLTEINKRITALLDREHQIGHSYFMDVENVDDLSYVFKQKILPLLQEYFFDDYETIKTVLSADFIKTQNVSINGIDKSIYSLSLPTDASAYIRIYNNAVDGSTAE